MMGTNVTIKVKTEKQRLPQTQAAIEKAVSRMQALIVDTVSSWEADSQTSQINQNAGKASVPVSDDLMQILLKAQDVSKLSNGAFDITFSAVGQLWKLRPVLPVIPSQEEIDEALTRVGYRHLRLDTDAMTAFLEKDRMRIDLGGIAKGSVVDAGAKSLQADGFTHFLINAGGDLRVNAPAGQPGWRVGITNPLDPRGPVLEMVERQQGAIVTSGDYEKMVEINGTRYHHIIDPRTGLPAAGCISVTVIADTAQTADALATAFFVLGPQKGLCVMRTTPRRRSLFYRHGS